MLSGLITTGPELNRLVEHADYLFLDYETIGVEYMRSPALGFSVLTNVGCGYVPLVSYRTEDDGVQRPPFDATLAGEILRPIIARVPTLNWAIKYDLHYLHRLTQTYPAHALDVQVAYWLLVEANTLKLKEVVEIVTDEPQEDYKDLERRAAEIVREQLLAQRETWVHQRKELYGELITANRTKANAIFPSRKVTGADIPIEWLVPYCIKDVLDTAGMWFGYVREGLKHDGLLDYFYSYEVPFTKVLWAMEEKGIAIDLDTLRSEEIVLEDSIARIDDEIAQIVGRQVNCGSIQQLQKLLFEELGFTPSGRLTKTGNNALDEEALQLCDLAHHDKTPIFGMLRQRRELDKVRGTFCVGLRDEIINGRVHTHFRQEGTQTGRLSSSDPNIQQIKKDGPIRKAFVPSVGLRFMKADLSQAELRILADRTQDPLLLEVYRDPKGDLHRKTMERVGITDRRLAKVLNFGVNYGIGPEAYHDNLFFEVGVDRPMDLCKQDIKNFYDVYRGIKPWKQRVWDWGKINGYVETRFGRRRHVDLDAKDYGTRAYAERQAVNVLIQGDVADIIKAAMVRINPQLSQFGASMLLQAHDELGFEYPPEVEREFAAFVRKEMETIIEAGIPILADIEVGNSWGETVKLERVR